MIDILINTQIYNPIQLNKFMINTTKSKIPPPPPLPPPPPPPIDKYQKMLKLGISKDAIEQKKTLDRIQACDLQNVKLKKTNITNKNHKKKNNNYESKTINLNIIIYVYYHLKIHTQVSYESYIQMYNINMKNIRILYFSL